jgi:RNA polymerase sigma factor (sigma-70 family)
VAGNGRAHRAVVGDGVGRWFAGAQRGDPEAVDGLLRAVMPTAQRFSARSCASREDAEDAVQDALMALVRRVRMLRAAEAVTSWLFVTIRHSCLRRARGVVLVPIDLAGDLAGADLSGRVIDRVTVAAALAALPATHREVIVLVDLLDQPVEWTARQLGISARAAKSRPNRALAAVIGQADIRRSA